MELIAESETKVTRLNTIERRRCGKHYRESEARNFIYADMKRNDPVTHRFIQYVLMRPGNLLILVKVGRTGRVVVAPDEKHRWISRLRLGDLGEQRPITDEDWDVDFEVDM